MNIRSDFVVAVLIDKQLIQTNFDKAVKQATTLALSPDAKDLPGYGS